MELKSLIFTPKCKRVDFLSKQKAENYLSLRIHALIS